LIPYRIPLIVIIVIFLIIGIVYSRLGALVNWRVPKRLMGFVYSGAIF
jgi:hypothetical protein